jgi:transcriptional regulator with XRE-family HTH domain
MNKDFNSMKNSTELRGPWARGGLEIAALRTACEITQKELVEQANLPSRSWIEDVEAGRRPVASAFYKSLAAVLGLETADFAKLCLKYYDPKAYEAIFAVQTDETFKIAA